MRKTDLLVGILIGLAAALLGSYLFIILFIDGDIGIGLQKVEQSDNMGKIITLGAVLNLIAFFALLHYKRELMARGVILATILLALMTLFF